MIPNSQEVFAARLSDTPIMLKKRFTRFNRKKFVRWALKNGVIKPGSYTDGTIFLVQEDFAVPVNAGPYRMEVHRAGQYIVFTDLYAKKK